MISTKLVRWLYALSLGLALCASSAQEASAQRRQNLRGKRTVVDQGHNRVEKNGDTFGKRVPKARPNRNHAGERGDVHPASMANALKRGEGPVNKATQQRSQESKGSQRQGGAEKFDPFGSLSQTMPQGKQRSEGDQRQGRKASDQRKTGTRQSARKRLTGMRLSALGKRNGALIRSIQRELTLKNNGTGGDNTLISADEIVVTSDPSRLSSVKFRYGNDFGTAKVLKNGRIEFSYQDQDGNDLDDLDIGADFAFGNDGIMGE